MKIDIICFAGNSGLGDYSISLARALKQAGAEVRVLTSSQMPEEVAGLFNCVEMPFRRTRQLHIDYFRMARAVLRRKPDAVIIQSWKFPLADIAFIKQFQKAGIAAIATVHDVVPHRPRAWSQFDIPMFFRAFNGLVAHSSEAAGRLQAAGVQAPIAIIPHGVYDIFDIDHLSQTEARATFDNLNENDFVALFFGHLEERKGVLEFANAISMLRNDQDIKFLIAGRLDGGVEVRSALEALDDDDRVHLFDRYVPFVDVQRYFQAADVVVTPYREGTTSGVVKLAIAFGRPILSTNVGDAADTIASPYGSVGLLIEGENVAQSIAQGLLLIRSERADYSTALSKLRHSLSWDVVGLQYLNFVDSIIRRQVS